MPLKKNFRTSKIGAYLSVPLNERINQRGMGGRTISSEFDELLGVPKKRSFTRSGAGKVLDKNSSTMNFFETTGRLAVEQTSGLQKRVKREELVRFVKGRELHLGIREAHLVCNKLIGSNGLSYGQFLTEAQKTGVLQKGKEKSQLIYFADVAKIASRMKQVLSWPNLEQLAKIIGMNQETVRTNWKKEKGLAGESVRLQLPNGGFEYRVPPQVVQRIIQRQSGLTSMQAKDYLAKKGIALKHNLIFKYFKRGIIRANKEEGFDGKQRVSVEELDRFVSEYPQIMERINKNASKRKALGRRSYLIKIGAKVRPLGEKAKVNGGAKNNDGLSYSSERDAFIQRNRITPQQFTLMEEIYKSTFQGKPVPSAEAIAGLITQKTGKRINSYAPIYNFATWVVAHKWAELTAKEKG